MKKLIALIIAILVLLSFENIFALEGFDSFYKAEIIEGVTYSKFNASRQNRQAYIQRRNRDNMPVYCTEPFDLVKENYYYRAAATEAEVLTKFSVAVAKRIKLIAYYGYGYKGHEDTKWYSITQIMMWRTIDPVNKFEWTDTLGGNIIKPYDKEIAEIESLIVVHDKKPTLAEHINLFSIGKTLALSDDNVNLADFEVVETNSASSIKDGKLILDRTKIGDYSIKIKKISNRISEAPIFYFDDVHQDIVSLGKIESPIYEIKYRVLAGRITVEKIDRDNQNNIARGEAQLIGAVYDLINSSGEVIGKITIGEDFKGGIDNLPLGKYTLKETMSGNGYTLDKETYTIDLNHGKTEVSIKLSNKVIENKIKLNKYFGTNGNFKAERNINFEIYDSKGNLVKVMTTDDNGLAQISLPYGSYTIKQKNSTEGYYRVNDMIVLVDEDNLVQEYDLVDLKIPDANVITYKMPVYYYRKLDD